MAESTFMWGAGAAIIAAFLFGASAPVAKVLVATTSPLMLGATLYLGAGMGLTAVRLARGARQDEAGLRRKDVPTLVAIAMAGGLLAPLLLLVGLGRVSGVTGSLLLNLEGPLTVLLAVVWFGDYVGLRAGTGIAAMMLGAATLAMTAGVTTPDALGTLAVVGACLGWAIDNNLTQLLSLRDPLEIAQVKGLVGGGTALAIALSTGQAIPPFPSLVAGLVLGFVSYGLSVVLAVYAMRSIGVAREAALFSSAPFMGVVLSVLMLHESVGVRELAALASMLTGLALMATERHSHRHRHEALGHDHRHTHDLHHQHAHAADDPPGEPHAHEHTHEPLDHEHPHAQDVHHRHH